METGSVRHTPKILIVGCGLGGLSCAISCLNQGLDVQMLEKAPKILEIGAGIMVPPNATRILQYFGLLEKFKNSGAVEVANLSLRRYSDGRVLANRPGGQKMIRDFGSPWCSVHRADYHRILMDEALRLGAKIREGAEVQNVHFSDAPYVTLAGDEKVYGDVVIGADGLWSNVRNQLLGTASPPSDTGDLAYRAIFSKSQLAELNHPRVNALLNDKSANIWIGPDKHCVFYPIKGGNQFNLVLLRPDNLEVGLKGAEGDIEEMRESFKGWDPTLTLLISGITFVLKWKLYHKDELAKWVKGNVALLGDSCHPSLPYQAQGAAMACEDGAVVGILLGNLYRSSLGAHGQANRYVSAVLELFESQRKERTSINQEGAFQNRRFYHLHDGPLQIERDKMLASIDWTGNCEWNWGSIAYLKDLLAFDVVAAAETAFDHWLQEKKPPPQNKADLHSAAVKFSV